MKLMMEESGEGKIQLSYLESAGVSIPSSVLSITDLTPAAFVSVCAQSLNLMDATASFPSSLPSSTIDKFKICSDIALEIKRLGYIGEMSYNKLLYPSEEELCKVTRFLVERLSKSSAAAKITDPMEVNARRKVKDYAKDPRSPAEKTDNGGLDLNVLEETLESLTLQDVESSSKDEEAGFSGPRTEQSSMDGLCAMVSESHMNDEGKSREGTLKNEDDANQRDDTQKVNSINNESSKIRYETENLQNQEKLLMEEMAAGKSELPHLEEEFELLKAASEMVFDDQHSIDYHLEKLNEQIHVRKCNVAEVISQGDAVRRSLEEKKRSLVDSVYAKIPKAQEKVQKLREAEQEKQLVQSQIRKLEEEHSKLLAELEKQPKVPPRTTYIERIKEITKNSRKQDADIQRIIKETRELQLESNSIQERLHRTYTVLDEIVSREAKKDTVGRQAYRLLNIIHDSFEQISEKILATDRRHRERAKLEKQLAALASRRSNADKLQADLEAIKMENENPENSLQDS